MGLMIRTLCSWLAFCNVTLANGDIVVLSSYRRSWYFHSNILDSLAAWLAGIQLNPVFLFPPRQAMSESTIEQMTHFGVYPLVCPFSTWPGQGFYVDLFVGDG